MSQRCLAEIVAHFVDRIEKPSMFRSDMKSYLPFINVIFGSLVTLSFDPISSVSTVTILGVLFITSVSTSVSKEFQVIYGTWRENIWLAPSARLDHLAHLHDRSESSLNTL